MGEGQLLLKLQETDLELVRHRSELNALPEIKSLAQKRKSLAAAKDELLRVTGRRKDLETYLGELDEEERLCLEDIEHAQEHAASAMITAKCRISNTTLTLAKELDKIAFERKDYQSQLEVISSARRRALRLSLSSRKPSSLPRKLLAIMLPVSKRTSSDARGRARRFCPAFLLTFSSVMRRRPSAITGLPSSAFKDPSPRFAA